MNLPNKLTLVRIILIPVIMIIYAIKPLREIYVFNGLPYLSLTNLLILIISALAMLTDMLDGKIARKYNLVTDLGKFLDPLADKLLVLTLLCILMDESSYYDNQFILWWEVIIILAREFMVTGMRLVAAGKKQVIAASWFGKIKTTLQFIAILYLLMGGARLMVPVEGTTTTARAPLTGGYLVYSFFGKVLIVLMLAATIYSGIDYMVKNRSVFADANAKKNKKGE